MGFNFKKKQVNKALNLNAAPVRKNIAKWQWYLVVVIVLSPLLYFAWLLFSNYFFIKAQGFVQFDLFHVRSPEKAYIKSIDVRSGEEVKKGQLLLRLSSKELDSEFKSIQTQITLLQEASKEHKDHEYHYLLKMANEAKRYIEQTETMYNNFSSYRDQGIMTTLELQTSQRDMHEARQELHQIERQIAENRSRNTLDQESVYRRELRALMADLKQLHTRIEALNIYAPVAGVVNEVFLHQYSFTLSGDEIMDISTYQGLHIKAYLNPKFLGRVEKNDRVIIKFADGYAIKGMVSTKPNFSTQSTKTPTVFDDKNKKVVLIIKPLEILPQKYMVNYLPVSVEIGTVLSGY